MSGASRWLDAKTPVTDVAAMRRAPTTPATLDRVDKTVSPGDVAAGSDLPEARLGESS